MFETSVEFGRKGGMPVSINVWRKKHLRCEKEGRVREVEGWIGPGRSTNDLLRGTSTDFFCKESALTDPSLEYWMAGYTGFFAKTDAFILFDA